MSRQRPAEPTQASAWGRWSLVACLAIGALIVGMFVHRGLEATGGVAAAPLDDAYIHLQYARTIAEGHPFRYHAGEPASSGASSLLYVVLLAVPYALGATGLRLLWVAWVLGAAVLGMALFLAGELAARLVGPSPWSRLVGIVAVAAWAWLGWHAASGMESGLTAALVLGAWVAAVRWAACSPPARTLRGGVVIAGLATALPLTRPEAAPFALCLGVLLVTVPVRGRSAGRWLGLACLLGIGLHPLVWWLFTGSPTTNGATVKWFLRNPYLDGQSFTYVLQRNAVQFRMFWMNQGDRWTAGFFPTGIAAAGVLAGAIAALWARRPGRGALVLLLGATAACFAGELTFANFADHRFRYVVPYVPPLLVLGAVALYQLGDLVGRRWRRIEIAPALGLVVGATLLGTWPYALSQYGRCAAEIANQHYRMAARFDTLPKGARIGTTDAGVLAYLGHRRTLDLVGLTTNATTLYYHSGVGSRLEMLERMLPSERPTFFATYQGWWPLPELLGRPIARFPIPKGKPLTIVGGPVMILAEARLADLGRGERPVVYHPDGPLLDAVDVADVLDERTHGYHAEGSGWVDDFYGAYVVRGVGRVLDGGRRVPTFERMTLAGQPGQPLVLVLRTHADRSVVLQVEVNGEAVGKMRVMRAPGWQEIPFHVPAVAVRNENRIVVRRLSPGALASFHWWAYGSGPP